MGQFEFTPLVLGGAYAIKNFCYSDQRGSFIKSFEKQIYSHGGIKFDISETFVSVSSQNVIRGLHFQLNAPQSKLICLLSGKAWDVIVDLRKSSPTYKKWVSIDLDSNGKNAVFVPRGFAHGFASLENNTTMIYQCEGPYDKETDTGIIYNDPTLNITWPIADSEAILSDRDKSLMLFSEFEERVKEYGTYE